MQGFRQFCESRTFASTDEPGQFGHEYPGVGFSLSETAQPSVPVMYHYTSSNNRAHIQAHGLLRSEGASAKMGGYGGIFLATKLGKGDPGYIDTWQVNVKGIGLEPDDTTDPTDEDDSWWVTYDEDIPPSRLHLLRPGLHRPR